MPLLWLMSKPFSSIQNKNGAGYNKWRWIYWKLNHLSRSQFKGLRSPTAPLDDVQRRSVQRQIKYTMGAGHAWSAKSRPRVAWTFVLPRRCHWGAVVRHFSPPFSLVGKEYLVNSFQFAEPRETLLKRSHFFLFRHKVHFLSLAGPIPYILGERSQQFRPGQSLIPRSAGLLQGRPAFRSFGRPRVGHRRRRQLCQPQR